MRLMTDAAYDCRTVYTFSYELLLNPYILQTGLLGASSKYQVMSFAAQNYAPYLA